ncbi:hypothetical protein [Litchfieldia salsa]|uniref:Uncharacterized protein n=1 Tax=Litchfieldia salsa TaxID=930152 RepID=A0A1H0WL16_9BACI|nr:hypothetical protein [Litchfieldia salsa]SDP91392.1 hypothetical protein SAMN05216565_11226 [Litchfieldia salsa]
MVGMWLTTIVIFGFIILGIIFIIQGLKSSMNIHDAIKIDPLPEEDYTEKK